MRTTASENNIYTKTGFHVMFFPPFKCITGLVQILARHFFDIFLFEITLEDEDVRASFCIYVSVTRYTIDEG